MKENLVLEIDGKYHNDPDVAEYDKLRTELFYQYGFKVIRFTNDEVLFGIENVLNEIKVQLRTITPPSGG